MPLSEDGTVAWETACGRFPLPLMLRISASARESLRWGRGPARPGTCPPLPPLRSRSGGPVRAAATRLLRYAPGRVGSRPALFSRAVGLRAARPLGARAASPPAVPPRRRPPAPGARGSRSLRRGAVVPSTACRSPSARSLRAVRPGVALRRARSVPVGAAPPRPPWAASLPGRGPRRAAAAQPPPGGVPPGGAPALLVLCSAAGSARGVGPGGHAEKTDENRRKTQEIGGKR